MKKILQLILLLILLTLNSVKFTSAADLPSCGIAPTTGYPEDTSRKISLGIQYSNPKYQVNLSFGQTPDNYFKIFDVYPVNGNITLDIQKTPGKINNLDLSETIFFKPGVIAITVIEPGTIWLGDRKVCRDFFTVLSNQSCSIITDKTAYNPGEKVSVSVTCKDAQVNFDLKIVNPFGAPIINDSIPVSSVLGDKTFSKSYSLKEGADGIWEAVVFQRGFSTSDTIYDSAAFYYTSSQKPAEPPNPVKFKKVSQTAIKPCSAINNTAELAKCELCIDKGTDANYGPGSWSALGCIPVRPDKFITWLLNNAINVVGGIAFLLILFGSLKVATSSGNPEALNEGKEIIFAAIAGLLFIILSVVLLKIIGGDILQIPDFGK